MTILTLNFLDGSEVCTFKTWKSQGSPLSWSTWAHKCHNSTLKVHKTQGEMKKCLVQNWANLLEGMQEDVCVLKASLDKLIRYLMISILKFSWCIFACSHAYLHPKNSSDLLGLEIHCWKERNN